MQSIEQSVVSRSKKYEVAKLKTIRCGLTAMLNNKGRLSWR